MSSIVVAQNTNKPITLELPEELGDLYEKVLIPFQRYIEKIYKDLPWPESMKNVLVETNVSGGKGDIAAAAKAIALMLRICPKDVSFDWMSMGADCDPLAFLTAEEASRVHHRWFNSLPLDTTPADFCLIGPVVGIEKEYIESRSGRTIEGPLYGFKEIAMKEMKPEYVNYKLFEVIFSTAMEFSMGIVPGSGVFLDQSRMHAPLSLDYCCPTYLRCIQDADLRKDILEAMEIYDETSIPDFDRYSFNSGYAHNSSSWEKFIDAVVIHENKKNVIIVLNHHGAFAMPSPEEFCDGILTEERLDLFKKLGYGSVTLKSQGKETVFLLSEERQKIRNVTLIMRPSFSPQDMRQLQLSSERLLATGDNSAIESWCAKCKLFLYETLSHKLRFEKQQIDLANKVAPSLARLLDLPRGSSTSDLAKAVTDPDLDKETLNFCNYIREHCSFAPIFEGGIKRAAWHHIIPQLMDVEEQTIDKDFQPDLLQYVADPASKKSLTISTLPQLEERVQNRVAVHITKSSLPPLGKDAEDLIAEYFVPA